MLERGTLDDDGADLVNGHHARGARCIREDRGLAKHLAGGEAPQHDGLAFGVELFVVWPPNPFGGEDLNISSAFYDIVKATMGHTTITVLHVADEAELKRRLQSKGIPLDKVKLRKVALEGPWVRDYGPLAIRTGNPGQHVVDLRYYPGRLADDAVPTRLAPARNWKISRPPLNLEGGNLQADGQGLCITSEEIQVSNPGADVRGLLRDYFSCTKTIILPRMKGYELTGHIDMFVMLTDVGQAMVGKVMTFEDDRGFDRDNAARLDRAAKQLQDAGITVTRVPMPRADSSGFRSYINAVPVNAVVLVPIYSNDSRYQASALDAFRRAFPGRRIVPVDSDSAIRAGGSVHCLTMTFPE